MRRPLKRHNLILLLGLLLYHSSFLTWATEVPTEKSGYKTENPEKREFTLQDLLNSQQTISSTSSSATAIKPIDLTALLAGSTQTQTQPSIIAAGHPKPTDIELSPDKYGRYNLDGAVANFLAKQQSTSSGGLQIEQPKPAISINDLQSLLQGHQVQLPKPDVAAASIESAPNVFHEELELGKQKLEIDSAGKRNVHYTVAKGADGQLSLVPVVDGSPQNGVEGLELLQAKEGISAKGQSRQQMQLTTLSQAMYSPFSSDMNSLHLHLKGKDGKDGKPGNKGPMGPLGPLGPAGPKGSKGDAGTCSNQINGLYECTPDELDSLSNRVDYLEKICRKKAVPPPFKPVGEKGTEGNPLASCQAIYESNPKSKSGPYWLMVKGVRFKTWCEFIQPGGTDDDERPPLAGGWTLVARIKGTATDWSPVSENWASNSTIAENTAHDMSVTTSMKNSGYHLIASNVLLLCFTGRNTGCAPFTHGRNMPLSKLFATQFGVVPDEEYTMAPFMKAIGKSCDLSILRQSWCGLNLANICDARNGNPNEKPPRTTHICRIGCIGDRTATCFPDDYAVGVGVTSCKDGFGCSNVGPSKNMHYRCDYVYGAFSQTAYLYVL